MKPYTFLRSMVRRRSERSSLRREPVRRWVRRILLVLAVVIMAPTVYPGRAVGQAHNDRGGSVGIQTEAEKNLFFSLICMCGCPRETLGTCTCDYANQRRSELRDMLTQGMTAQAIQKAYGARFGTESLAVPTNEGVGALIWALPLFAFIAGAFLVVRLLRKWTARGAAQVASAAGAHSGTTASPKADESSPSTDPNTKSGRDAYDDRLDDELKDLDRE